MSRISVALSYVLRRGLQIHPDALKILEQVEVNNLDEVVKTVVNQSIEQGKNIITKSDLELLLGLKEDLTLENNHEILSDPTPNIATAEGVEGYKLLFESRFKKFKKMILDRPNSEKIKSLSFVLSSKTKEDMIVCGLLYEITTEGDRMRLLLEDQTGMLEIMIYNEDVQDSAKKLFVDQFVMIRMGMTKNGAYMAKEIISPDIPEHKPNRSQTEVYAVFLSDLHIGSKFFMEKEFQKFIGWLSSQDPIALRVRFVLICGDVVDGVGIYPNQNKELEQLTLEKQLEKMVEILENIPQRIKVFIIPGNHDPGRRALPQPAIPKKYNEWLWNQENFFMLGNPAVVSLNGVQVLLYHGQSIDDIVKITPGLDYSIPTEVMKSMLKARHLSPIYGGQTSIAPEEHDMMVIDRVPDIFHTGHVHVAGVDRYRNVILINSGTWQTQTPFQTSVGIKPTPGLGVLVNLKTFDVKVVDDFR